VLNVPVISLFLVRHNYYKKQSFRETTEAIYSTLGQGKLAVESGDILLGFVEIIFIKQQRYNFVESAAK
jgi:hypothetical protein